MSPLSFALQSEGLTLEKIFTDIPHDAGAVVVYFLMALMAFLIWIGSRRSTVRRYASTPGTPTREALSGEAERTVQPPPSTAAARRSTERARRRSQNRRDRIPWVD